MNNGPSEKITKLVTELSLQDIIILKRFLDKGSRENLFIPQELHAVISIQKKLELIINKFLKEQSIKPGLTDPNK